MFGSYKISVLKKNLRRRAFYFYIRLFRIFFGPWRKSEKSCLSEQRLAAGVSQRIRGMLEHQQFVRYVMYLDINDFINKQFHSQKLSEPHIIEFGGSNQAIKELFSCDNYEVSKNWPAVDIQDLSNFQSEYYDFVVLDQILEHVPNPQKAVFEIHRILKNGGWLISTTPFLVRIHEEPAYSDYWRFTKKGSEKLLSCFSKVTSKSWGNKSTGIVHMMMGNWPSTQTMRNLGLMDLDNQEQYPYVVWCYAQK